MTPRRRLGAGFARRLAVVVLLAGGLHSCSPAKDCIGPDAFLIVCAEAEDLGGFVAKVGSARLVDPDVSSFILKPWAEHEVHLLNGGDEVVHLDNNRTGRLIGEDGVLFVATPGCGPGSGVAEQLGAVCDEDLGLETLAPGETLTLVFTLWRDLQAMGELKAGQYVFPWTVRHSTSGPFRPESPPRDAVTGTLRLYYRVR